MQARYADTGGKIHGERKAVKPAAKAVGYVIVSSCMRSRRKNPMATPPRAPGFPERSPFRKGQYIAIRSNLARCVPQVRCFISLIISMCKYWLPIEFDRMGDKKRQSMTSRVTSLQPSLILNRLSRCNLKMRSGIRCRSAHHPNGKALTYA
jgi:hypothetical protein